MTNETYVCKKCGITIGGHNQFLHDGMCDECFFETYFPEEIEIFEINTKKVPKTIIDEIIIKFLVISS